MKKIILSIILTIVLLLAVAVPALAADDVPPFKEKGAEFRMWDEIPPEYSEEASYNIFGTPGGEKVGN